MFLLLRTLAYWRYLVRRLLLLLVVMYGAVTLIFVLARLLGNPVDVFIGNHKTVNPQLAAEVTATWGLNKPLWIQYIDYLRNIVTGNLGTSFRTAQPVLSELVVRIPATIELSIAALAFAVLLAIPVGVFAATHKNSVFDIFTRIFSIAGYSAPAFWLAIILLVIFFRDLGWVGVGRLDPQFVPPPFVTGMYTVDSLLAGNYQVFVNAVEHLMLPGITLGLGGSAVAMRLLRSSMLEALASDYVRTARMNALSELVVVYKHAFRNALIPMITYFGVLTGGFLSGAVLVETIFSWSGLGQYAVAAIFADDYISLQGVVLFITLIYAAANLIVDLAYGIIDPRVRYG